MKEELMRVFFAITLEDDLKSQISTNIEYLKKTCALSVRWVKTTQLHLTLRFLGNITTLELDEINNRLAYFSEIPAFDLNLLGIISFPQHKPRVIGVSIEENEALTSLVQKLETELNTIGITPEERTFLPHITLGRIAKPRRRAIELESIGFPQTQHVSNITLFQSQLSPEGSTYSVLNEFHLKENVFHLIT